MLPVETITRFDRFLAERSLELDAVVIGGAALALLGVVSRPTRDCDILHPELPLQILEAARAFAAAMRESGEPLDDDWLNNRPASLTKDLPEGWLSRLQLVFEGSAIKLLACGPAQVQALRPLHRGLDIGDCIALAPTAEGASCRADMWAALESSLGLRGYPHSPRILCHRLAGQARLGASEGANSYA